MTNPLKLVSLEQAGKELARLREAEDVFAPNWSVSEICLHCAQTIDYSMTGYPVMKPPIIRNTIGKIAIRKFMRQGFMSHNLTAHVPGASKLDISVSSDEAIGTLMNTMDRFEHYNESLKPHLLFGSLTKAEYSKYFAMHIANHLDELRY